MAHPEPFAPPGVEGLSESLPGFHFETLIACSNTSAVYLATQTSLERHVAMRVYSPSASSNPSFVASVESMAQSMARLNHPNLIGIFDSGWVDGMLYLAMEFVAGKSLARSLGHHAIEHAQARAITASVCEGIAHAHQNHVAHGALSAENILLNPSAEPKIGNFAGGDFATDSTTDIVDIGKLLFQMLTGTVRSTFSPPPSKLVACPSDLDEICDRCINRDREDAFQTIQELCDALAPQKAVIPSNKTSVLQSLPARSIHKPAPARTASPKSGTNAKHPGFNWILARNIVVIIMLLFAIKLVLGITDRRKEEIQKLEQTANDKAAKSKAQPHRIIVRPATGQAFRVDPVFHPHQEATPPPPSEESSEASLERLRSALAGGNFNELPVGSRKRGNHAYLHVDQELSWPRACLFAEKHGAQLAAPTSIPDLEWLASITHGMPFWIGAGRSGRDTWSFLDGSAWTLPSVPAGMGNYAVSDKHGLLRAANGQNRMRFILQWNLDGSKPVTLETRLAEAARTSGSDTASYPAGTCVVGERAYLIASMDTTWEEAHDLAARSGGHLAVVSDTAESVHLRDLAAQLEFDQRYWIGARATGNRWHWVTAEAGSNNQWTEPVEGLALALSQDDWPACPVNDKLDGFIIEWSKDKGSSPAQSSGPVPAGPATNIHAIDTQAKQLVEDLIRKRDNSIKANANRMDWDLDIVYRNLSSSEQAVWQEPIQELKQITESQRLPASILTHTGNSHEAIGKITKYAISKQESIDAEFLAAADKIRIAYLKKILSVMSTPATPVEVKDELVAKQQAAAESRTWFELLGKQP